MSRMLMPGVGKVAVATLQFGMGRAISRRNGGKKMQVSAASCSEFTIARNSDGFSARILGAAMTCQQFDQVVLQTIEKATKLVVQEWRVGNAILSSFSQSTGGSRSSSNFLSESFSINFETLEHVSQSYRLAPVHIPKTLKVAKEALANRQVYILIFRQLAQEDLLNAALCCREWLQVASDPQLHVVEKHSVFYSLNHEDATVVDGELQPLSELREKKDDDDDSY